MTKQEKAQQALSKVYQSQSLINYPTIFEGFMEKGLPMHDIKPKENVFTFQAWRALGRYVKKGEHGVKVITWIDTEKIVEKDGNAEVVYGKRPWTSTVFHVSQTEAMESKAA